MAPNPGARPPPGRMADLDQIARSNSTTSAFIGNSARIPGWAQGNSASAQNGSSLPRPEQQPSTNNSRKRHLPPQTQSRQADPPQPSQQQPWTVQRIHSTPGGTTHSNGPQQPFTESVSSTRNNPQEIDIGSQSTVLPSPAPSDEATSPAATRARCSPTADEAPVLPDGATGTTGPSPQDNSEAAKRRRTDVGTNFRPADQNEKDVFGTWLTSLNQRTLQPDFAHPTAKRRVARLREAVETRDTFYMVLHQLILLWSVNQQEARSLMTGVVSDQVLDWACESLLETLRSGEGLAREATWWLVSFPIPLRGPDGSPSPLFVSNLVAMALFMKQYVVEWLHLLAIGARRGYPLRTKEMVSVLGLTSPTLLAVLFTVSRRTLGIFDVDPALSTINDLHRLFLLDQQCYFDQSMSQAEKLLHDTRVESNFQRLSALALAQARENSQSAGQAQRPNQQQGVPSNNTSQPAAVEMSGRRTSNARNGPHPPFANWPVPTHPMQAQGPASPQSANLSPGAGHQVPSPLDNVLAQPMFVYQVNHSQQQLRGSGYTTAGPMSPINGPLTTNYHVSQGRQFGAAVPPNINTGVMHRANSGQQSPVLSPGMPPMAASPQIGQQGATAAWPLPPVHASARAPTTQRRGSSIGGGSSSSQVHSNLVNARSNSAGFGLSPTNGPAAPSPVLSQPQPQPQPPTLRSHQALAPNRSLPARQVQYRAGHIRRPRPGSSQLKAQKLLPEPGWRIAPNEYPFEETMAVASSLHMADTLSPPRILYGTDGTSTTISTPHERYYQFVLDVVSGPAKFSTGLLNKFTFDVTEMDHHLLAQPSIAPGTNWQVYPYRDGTIRYRFRICEVPNSDVVGAGPNMSTWTTLSAMWPDTMTVKVNHDFFPKLQRKEYWRKARPCDITKHVVSGPNTLSVGVFSKPNGRSTYFGAVEKVITASHESVLDLVGKRRLPKEHTIGIIQSRLRNLDEDDVQASEELSISVADPFSAGLVKTAVRGQSCRHLDVFDLQTWLETRPTKRQCLHFLEKPADCEKCGMRNAAWQEPSEVDAWKCPICSADARPNSLRLDLFIQSVCDEIQRRGLEKSIKSVLVKADGTWRVVDDGGDSDDDDDDDGYGPTEATAIPRGPSSLVVGSKVKQVAEVIVLDDD